MTVIKPEFPSIIVPSRKTNPRKKTEKTNQKNTNQKNTNRKHTFCTATDPVSFEAEYKSDVGESDPVEEHKPFVAAEDQWFLDLLKRTKKQKHRVILASEVFGMATWLL